MEQLIVIFGTIEDFYVYWHLEFSIPTTSLKLSVYVLSKGLNWKVHVLIKMSVHDHPSENCPRLYFKIMAT